MCGLSGFWERPGASRAELTATAAAMARTIASRGPDDEGTWCDPELGLAVGHRRLAILDLSAEGHQPMIDEESGLVLAYNGEVYNFEELRAELEAEGVTFRGRSDTELVLRAIARWGLAAALERFAGMFAFALWDTRERTLTLVRDRLGIKPLYWGVVDGTLFFGSELKSFRPHPGFRPALDRDSLTLFFRFNYVPSPHCVYAGMEKLTPGSWVRVRERTKVERHTWWDARAVAREGAAARGRGGELPAALEELEERLGSAVRGRMIADVPLGAFLSGGIDSSAVVALMQAESSRPVRTFTIGFHEEGFDEAGYARSVAQHLGTDHSEIYVTPDEARAVIPRLAEMWDEPFSDSSQIPTYLVSRFAREHVTVCLSGDGGDELFGGYPRYWLGRRLARWLAPLPDPLRRGLGRAIRAVSPSLWNGLADRAPRLASLGLQPGWAAYRAGRLADLLGAGGSGPLYRQLVSHWKEPAELVLGAREPATVFDDPDLAREPAELLERMMLLDTLTYLPDDILCKVDRASMACGLEARVPLIDHRVFELAWTLPSGVRVGGPPGKRLLRAVLARRVPEELFERPKMGFGIPIAEWLRGPLRGWAEELLDERRLREEGVLAPGPVRRRWSEHLEGRSSWGYYLWDVLVFQSWRERWLAEDGAPRPLGREVRT